MCAKCEVPHLVSLNKRQAGEIASMVGFCVELGELKDCPMPAKLINEFSALFASWATTFENGNN